MLNYILVLCLYLFSLRIECKTPCIIMGYIKTNADIIHTAWINVKNKGIIAGTALYWAGYYIKTGNPSVGGAYLQDAGASYDLAFQQIGDISPYTKNNWYYTEDNLSGAYDLTMAAILNAMLASDSDEVLYFVGLVDAYRQSVWNVEYNQEFFAALARGFMP